MNRDEKLILAVRRAVEAAERDLGPLTFNQRVDLVYDRFEWIDDTVQARHVLMQAGLRNEGAGV